MSQNNNISEFIRGNPVVGWTAFDYHPHQRGLWWFVIFCTIIFGTALGVLLIGGTSGSNILMAFTLLLAAAVYFNAHRKGDETHKIQVFENALIIDNKTIPLEDFLGYWFVYDETVSVINFEHKDSKKRKKISFQMGEHNPDFFRGKFKTLDMEELDRKESLLDLWIRALKL